jgi:membrane protein implicated in regulation of membrane protease activity
MADHRATDAVRGISKCSARFCFFRDWSLTALLAALGIAPDLDSQLIAFSLTSLLSLLFFRKRARQLLDSRGKSQEYNEYAGETAMVIKDIPATGEGRIFYRGAEWTAISANHSPIEAGSKVVIRRTEGIKLIVEES